MSVCTGVTEIFEYGDQRSSPERNNNTAPTAAMRPKLFHSSARRSFRTRYKTGTIATVNHATGADRRYEIKRNAKTPSRLAAMLIEYAVIGGNASRYCPTTRL